MRNMLEPLGGPLNWLLNGATRGRIAVYLWRKYPSAYTVDEINRDLPLISRSRVQQVIQKMFEQGVVERDRRETGRPGPSPYEYKLTTFLHRIFKNGFSNR